MRMKRFLPLIIAMVTMAVMMAGQITVRATDTTTTVDVPSGAPNFVVYGDTKYVVNAGQKTKLSITLQNITDAYRCNFTATASDSKNIFDFESNSTEASGVGENSTVTLEYTVSTPAYTTAGKYTLQLALAGTYKDGETKDKASFSQTVNVTVEVKSDVKANSLTVTEYSMDKTDIKPADPFVLTVKLKNNCGLDLTGAKVSLDGLDGSKFAMNTGLATVTIDIKKNAEAVLQFQLVACAGISSIREVIPLKLSYMLNPNDKETLQENTTNMTVTCTVPKETTTADTTIFAPNIIIDKYSFGSDYVVGGKTFPLALTIRNTSTAATIQNLKVTIQGAAGTGTDAVIAYSPANSTNSFFFSKLGANASQNMNIDFLAKADAKPNSYPIQVVFDYEYTMNGKKDEAKGVIQTLTIPLQQDDRFEANAPEVEEASTIGQECAVNLTVVNKGKSAVYNVSVDTVGEGFDKTSSAYYIGNVESGKEEYYETKIIPNKEGEIKGEIVVTYEDSNGNQKEIRKEFITTASAMMMDTGMPEGGDVPANADVDGKKSPLKLIIGIVGAAAVLGAGTFVTLKVIKKKKLKAKEIEDDDEDI